MAGNDSPTTVAVIDIGSNTGRVVVYRYQAGGHLQLMAGSRASLRLVRDLDETGRLGDEAMERAWECLQDFRAIARGAGATRILVVATAAVRDAENGPAFIERIRKQLGFEVRILSGEEEARLGFLGAVGGLPVEHGLLFDLGGGSLQVSRFRRRRLMSSMSLPLGALRLSDAFLKTDPPTAKEVRRLREHVREALKEADVERLERGECLIGTGGTVRNLAKVDRRSRHYPIARLHGYSLARRSVKEIAELLASRRLRRREQIPGLSEERGDSIVGGALAVETLMEVLKAPAVQVSGQGVREGLAISLVTDELPSPASVRESSLAALTSRFDSWVEEPARRRSELAASLYASLELDANPEIKDALLQAATILDIGRSIDFFDRHEHVADIVLATDLNGFSHRAVALLSAVLRRTGEAKADIKAYAPLLTPEDRPAVERAAVLLAVADDIEERCPRGVQLSLNCQVRKDQVVVSVPALGGWRPRTIARRFEKAFGRKLAVIGDNSSSATEGVPLDEVRRKYGLKRRPARKAARRAR
jgi:exopolyphosphatase/guanosine-5'-triphosphate,3'-diphosphate pyrophosphatase